jgi:hypothetical protein
VVPMNFQIRGERFARGKEAPRPARTECRESHSVSDQVSGLIEIAEDGVNLTLAEGLSVLPAASRAPDPLNLATDRNKTDRYVYRRYHWLG